MRLSFGVFVFDSDRRLLLRDGEPVHLTPKAFDLLVLLIERRPVAVAKQELYDHLWPDSFVEPGSLDTLVSRVRAALAEGGSARFIRTIYGFGYAFEGGDDALAPASRRAPRVVFGDGSSTVPLAAGENLVGRARDAVVSIDSSKVSRRHARIVVAPNEVTIEDLASRNGTHVNDQRITAPTVLHDGDEISVGAHTLTFHDTPRDIATTDFLKLPRL
jgi:hypothetical protein